MQTHQGIAVSPGIAIGAALTIDNERFRIPHRRISRSDVASELQRYATAHAAVAAEIEQRCQAVTAELGPQYAAIFEAHLQMLRDPQLESGVHGLLQQDLCSIEYAVSATLRKYAEVFSRSGSHYMAERAHDIYDIEKLLLTELLGKRREELAHLTRPVVLLSHELTPSETAKLNRQMVLGFVTESGGAGGHVAIVAEALEIPAVVGTGEILANIRSGDLVIVDGDTGCVVVRPDPSTMERYRQHVTAHQQRVVELSRLREMPAETLDGTRIQLLANIEFPHEAESCLQRGVEGIGLYRTEFLYLGRSEEPSEEDQFQAYRRVAQAVGDRPVVIRTLDLGADKLNVMSDVEEQERNPFLGLRSIRLSLRHPQMFRRQLRAILRASVFGRLRLMFPLISTLSELEEARSVLLDVQSELHQEGVPYDPKMPVGIMVEVPAVILMIDRFLERVDFISLGTNDLVQYALAVDRSNKDVAALYSNADPAVLRLIDMVVRAVRHSQVPVSLCGQMSADPKYVMLLIGMGLRSLSVPPLVVPEIKKVCRSVTLQKCCEVAKHALLLDTAAEVREYLQSELQAVAPEFVANS